MKMFVPLAAALVIAGPAAAQSSHAAHHPTGSLPATAMSGDKRCPKMDEMSGNMEQMKQMHQQMMGQMAQMMQMMQSMQQHQGMVSGPAMKMPMQGGMNMPMQPGNPGQNTPPPDPHQH